MNNDPLPVAVIGAGPVGLAAAAELVKRGATPLVLEAGDAVGAAVLRWGHVRIFSPWKYNIAPAARDLLERSGWVAPDGDGYPTGRDLVDAYLTPLAAVPEIAPHLRLGHRVTRVTRRGFDKMKTAGRDDAPFAITVETNDGESEVLARAVIDASGTYGLPNPIGA
ncbi:MAG TPA: NAD(P)-binding domain-containing protein, partial [Candidatus Limnocylindrales bacterium]|nr:NAD(P)-binding domain-containing protein [Candidatus Limnocylindrales bacterium]